MGLTSIYASGNDRLEAPELRENGSRESGTLNSTSPQGNENTKYTVADIEGMISTAESKTIDAQDRNSFDSKMDALNSREPFTSFVSDTGFDDKYTEPQVDFSPYPPMIPTSLKTGFVVDTNFMISHLNTVKGLRELSQHYHHQIIIPLTVIQELDGLKVSSKTVEDKSISAHGERVGTLARRANDWIYTNLANLDSSVVAQKLRQTLNRYCVKDDSILDCCLYFQENLNYFVILLSNDKNLCLKALKEDLPTVSFRKGMNSLLIASKGYEENIRRLGPLEVADISMEQPMDRVEQRQQNFVSFSEVSQQVYDETTQAVVDAIDFVMVKEYGEDLELVGYSPKTLENLNDAAKCFSRFWISTFTDYFKRSTIKNVWKTLSPDLTGISSNTQTLSRFLTFWVDVLHHLFSLRTEDDNDKLQVLINRWEHLLHSCE